MMVLSRFIAARSARARWGKRILFPAGNEEGMNPPPSYSPSRAPRRTSPKKKRTPPRLLMSPLLLVMMWFPEIWFRVPWRRATSYYYEVETLKIFYVKKFIRTPF